MYTIQSFSKANLQKVANKKTQRDATATHPSTSTQQRAHTHFHSLGTLHHEQEREALADVIVRHSLFGN